MSIRMAAETVNADKETVRKILHGKLNIMKICVKLNPKKTGLSVSGHGQLT